MSIKLILKKAKRVGVSYLQGLDADHDFVMIE